MNVSNFVIEYRNGKLTEASRDVLKEQFGLLGDGWHKVVIQESKTGKYTPTRYRFYFGILLPIILENCAGRFSVIDHNTGEQRAIRNTTELHKGLKMMYNPITFITPNGTFTDGDTTTGLSDRKFINEFMETIMGEFSMPPYNCDFSRIEDRNSSF